MNYLINITFHITNFFLFAFLSYWAGHYLNTLFQIPEPYNFIISLVGSGFFSYKIYKYFKSHRPVFNDIDYEKDNYEGKVKEKISWFSWIIPIFILIGIGLFSLAKSPSIQNLKSMNKKLIANKIKLDETKNIKWKSLSKSKKWELFIKPTTYTLPIPVRKITILVNSTSSFKIKEKKGKSTLAIMEIDCSINKYRFINRKSFTEKNGLGVLLYSNSIVKEWNIIKETSHFKNVREYVCKKNK